MVSKYKGTKPEDDFNDLFDSKYKEAKKLAPADLKLILLGDSAVGKSK
jgi:hypothetical protein